MILRAQKGEKWGRVQSENQSRFAQPLVRRRERERESPPLPPTISFRSLPAPFPAVARTLKRSSPLKHGSSVRLKI